MSTMTITKTATLCVTDMPMVTCKAHPRKSTQKIAILTHAYYNCKPTKSGENAAVGEKFCDDFARRWCS